MRHFVGEAGNSFALLLNKYLETGDSSFFPWPMHRRWNDILLYAASLPASQKLHYSGLDFESPRAYVKGLKTMLPAAAPPEAIRSGIDLIRNAEDTSRSCDYTITLNAQLKKALSENRALFSDYLGGDYPVFERIVDNKGNCKDVFKNRNRHMAESFISLEQQLGDSVCFGEFGEAHTTLNSGNLASIINHTVPYQGRVAVINLYCYDCHVPNEEVSNWPLHPIEKDILQYFLPFCEDGFTLFDLSDPDPVVARYRAYGQFLIVAKGQH
jgi:hypothetical protein